MNSPIATENYQRWREACLKERAESATLSRLSRGEMVGRLPLGYSYRWQGEKATVDLDTERASLVAEAFSLAGRKGMPLRRVLPVLQAKGLTSGKGTAISLMTLHRVLTNPFYCGMTPYRGKLYPGAHPTLVSRTVFAKVRTNLKKRAPGKR